MKHLDYRIEILTNDHAVGWVFLRDAPESHVSVDIFIGDKLLGTATANCYREDLARGGIGSGDHGFNFRFPGRLGDSALDQIRFMETTTGRELKSPRKKTKDVVSSRSAENGSTIYKKTKAELKGLIKSALAANYSSYSCKDRIPTGNSYQTILLGDESVGGFRTARDEVIQLLQLEGRTVLDLGCNLGELSRQCRRRGAARVKGIEYDQFFVLLANLINIYNGVSSVDIIQGDITNEFMFEEEFDYVLAFSIFTYISHRISEIASSTRCLAIFETHKIEADWRDKYVEAIHRAFPHIAIFGTTDWGTPDQFTVGRRKLIAAGKIQNEVWALLLQLQESGENAPGRGFLDLGKSDIGTFRELRNWLSHHDLREALDVPAHVPLDKALALPKATYIDHVAYWLEFFRGYRQYLDDGGINEQNSYNQFYKRFILKNPKYDPGAVRSLEDDARRIFRIEKRFENFKMLDAAQASGDISAVSNIMFLNEKLDSGTFRIFDVDRRDFRVFTALDGFHRLAAAYFFGCERMPFVSVELIPADPEWLL